MLVFQVSDFKYFSGSTGRKAVRAGKRDLRGKADGEEQWAVPGLSKLLRAAAVDEPGASVAPWIRTGGRAAARGFRIQVRLAAGRYA
jgi:hypothetical protein